MLNGQKEEIINGYARHKKDTGSPEVQIALLTERINRLTDHLRAHRKDFHSTRGLITMVSKRRKMMKYLKESNIDGYRGIAEKLNIRIKNAS